MHVAGSPTDEFNFRLDLFYSGAFDEQKHPNFNFKWAIIRPKDKKWAIVNHPSEILDMKTKTFTKNQDTVWLDISNALSIIKNLIKPEMILPHLICFDGMTKLRYIF